MKKKNPSFYPSIMDKNYIIIESRLAYKKLAEIEKRLIDSLKNLGFDFPEKTAAIKIDEDNSDTLLYSVTKSDEDNSEIPLYTREESDKAFVDLLEIVSDLNLVRINIKKISEKINEKYLDIAKISIIFLYTIGKMDFIGRLYEYVEHILIETAKIRGFEINEAIKKISLVR